MAGISPAENKNEKLRSEYAMSFISNSEDFLEKNKELDAQTLQTRWKKEIGNSWDIQSDNKEYYYATLEALDPDGPQAARQKVLMSLVEDISTKITPQEREWKMKELARILPDYAWDNGQFLELLSKEKGILDGQLEETARIGAILNTKYGLVDQSFDGLDPDKTAQAHTEDYLRGLRMGHDKDIRVSEGQFSIPVDGKNVPLSAITDPENIDLRQAFIEFKDLKPIIENKVTNAHRISQAKSMKDREETQEMVFDNIGNLPREFHTNIIRDYALTQRNSDELTYNTIEKLVRQEEDSSALDKIISFRSYFSELLSRTRRMIDDDSTA
jgi:hypothetical protein